MSATAIGAECPAGRRFQSKSGTLIKANVRSITSWAKRHGPALRMVPHRAAPGSNPCLACIAILSAMAEARTPAATNKQTTAEGPQKGAAPK